MEDHPEIPFERQLGEQEPEMPRELLNQNLPEVPYQRELEQQPEMPKPNKDHLYQMF